MELVKSQRLLSDKVIYTFGPGLLKYLSPFQITLQKIMSIVVFIREKKTEKPQVALADFADRNLKCNRIKLTLNSE